MKNYFLTLVGVLLFAVSTTGLAKILVSKAATTSMNQPKIASPNTPSTKLKQGWRLGAPVKHENLTIFPVFTDEPTNTDEFITLDAGIRSGKVKVTEMVATASRTRRIPLQRNAQSNQAVQQEAIVQSDGAEVNKVLVINNSGKTLVLIAGEIILGGKQDRIVGHDCIVASTNTPMPIDVFCVEHGRWQDTTSRGSRSVATGSAGNPPPMPPPPPAFAPADEVMAAPQVRANAQAKKSQSEVWSEVAEKVTKNHVSTSTGTLNSVYGDKRVSTKLTAYQNAIKTRFNDKTIVGAIVAINGKVVSADVFASPQLFQAYQAKLLKSYALEAISADKSAHQEVKASDAETFLSRSDGSESAVEKDGVYRLAEKQSGSDASFELEHTAKSAKLIHFNRVMKK
jgi:hypothetical protein